MSGQGNPGLHIGTSGWSYKGWVGPFYPPRTPQGDYLRHYAGEFQVVEVDSTFYRIPHPRMVENWREATPEGFIFCPKGPQLITHEKRLRDCGAELGLFLDSLGRLGPKLGPIVWQFEYTFQADEIETLDRFLGELPETHRYAVEIRHRSWLRDDFYGLLERHRVALVLADLFYMPKLNRATTDFAYIRLLGKRSEVPDDFSRVVINRDKELTLWSGRIREFLAQGLGVFVFANNRFQGHGPATVRTLMSLLERAE